MRLLQRDGTGRLTLTKDLDGDSIPEYAILSHTWGCDEEEVTFDDLTNGTGEDKPGYEKIRFCDEQASRDGLRYFWIDTCCIDKSSEAELARSINSMFRWYRNASRCYVYLSDVSCTSVDTNNEGRQAHWELDFRRSRWFTRGWTLQELLAPASVAFFSREGKQLSDKTSLGQVICEITNIPHSALQGDPLSQFSFQERSRWIQHRQATREEDIAYSLLGIFDVYILPIYGEGKADALARLKDEFDKMQRCIQDLHLTDPRDDKKRIEETKGGLLKDSYRWILDDSDFKQWRTAHQSRLLWIKGDPGKGKTMLLCGIINELERSTASSDLLSYFFYQATDSRINNATAMLRGLIYMLVDQQPSLVSHVRKKYDQRGKALFEDANAWVALSEIFTSILQDSSLNATYLIIDALDECVTDLPKLLEFIVRKSSESPRVKWVISSRNWPDIGEWLVNAGQNLSLELNAESISAAVSTFTQHKVLELAQRKKYNNKIRDAVLHHLSANANGTFLWVALVCQDLENIPKFAVLAKLNDFPPGLNALYERMMKQIRNSDYADLCNRILATIAIVYRPVTLLELKSLIDFLDDASDDMESLEEIVGFCGSFLTVREGAIYFVHQSAKDFLSAKAASEIFPFGQKGTHHDIFLKSLEVMSRTLKRDIYGLKAPGISIDQVEKPEPDPLAAARYSSLFWVNHLIDCCIIVHTINDPEDGGSIYKFLTERFLYWLEALSLMKSLSDGIIMIIKLENLQVIGNPHLLAFVHDAKRFALYNRVSIEQTPLQSYCSVLIFSPEKSIIRQTFEHCIPPWIQRKPRVQMHWSAALLTLEGHSDSVFSVAFSPDGKQVVSGSSDKTVRLWDAVTGAILETLQGHSDVVSSVEFSPDGKHIISGSWDHTARLWNTVTGATLHILEGHLDGVKSVAFSPDGKLIVSGSRDDTVRLWDAVTGATLHILEGHLGIVNSVAFSSDSKQILSGSGDTTTRLWDTASGAALQIFEGAERGIDSVAFSRDNKQVVSGSYDNMVRLWDATTGAISETLQGHSSGVSSVAFSPDGKNIVSGSWDHTVRLWNAAGAAMNTLKGHTNVVYSVAFSPDSKQVVSGSWDHTVRLWDIADAGLHAHEGHSDQVSSVFFSPDGSQVVSQDGDGLLRLWDATGAALQTLTERSERRPSFAFSPDSKQIVAGSSDGIVQLWANTGAKLQTLQSFSGDLHMVDFSLDGKQIICESGNNRVQVWDAVTGDLLQTLEAGHSSHRFTDPFLSYKYQLTTLNTHYNWVVDGGSKILLLPPDYRAASEAFWGESAVLGHDSGRISFLHFGPEPKLIM